MSERCVCSLLKELGHLGPELGGHTNEGAALSSDHYITGVES